MFELMIPDHTRRGALDELRAQLTTISYGLNQLSSARFPHFVRDLQILKEIRSQSAEGVGTTSVTFGLIRLPQPEDATESEWVATATFLADGTASLDSIPGSGIAATHDVWAQIAIEVLALAKIGTDDLGKEIERRSKELAAILLTMRSSGRPSRPSRGRK